MIPITVNTEICEIFNGMKIRESIVDEMMNVYNGPAVIHDDFFRHYEWRIMYGDRTFAVISSRSRGTEIYADYKDEEHIQKNKNKVIEFLTVLQNKLGNEL